jgi:hypothetical protein
MSTHKKSTSTKSQKSEVVTSNDETGSADAKGASALQVAPPPPTQHAPAVPANFDLTQRVGRGAGIWPTLATLAAPMASEVQSSSTFGDDFGTKVDQAAFAEILSTVAAWRAEWDRANDWVAYVRAGSSANVRVAQKQLERFRGAFEHAASRRWSSATRSSTSSIAHRARGGRARPTPARTTKRRRRARRPRRLPPTPNRRRPTPPSPRPPRRPRRRERRTTRPAPKRRGGSSSESSTEAPESRPRARRHRQAPRAAAGAGARQEARAAAAADARALLLPACESAR